MTLQRLLDTAALYAIGAALLALQTPGWPAVAPLLAAAVLVGLLSYVDWRPLKSGLFIVGALLCLVFPSLGFFLPAALYAYLERSIGYLFLSIPLIALIGSPLTWSARLYIAPIVVLAALLKGRTTYAEEADRRRVKIQDDYREMKRRLVMHEELAELAQEEKIRLATLEERNRIAREMHDLVGHQLSSALLQVGAMIAAAEESASLETLKNTLRQAMESVRHSVYELYDTSIDLTSALEGLANSFTFCEVQLSFCFDTSPPPKVVMSLVAVAKEGLANVAKHSNATLVRINFFEHPAFYQFLVADNGSLATHQSERGLGLSNIANRVENLGGHFAVRNEKGFELFLTIPKNTGALVKRG